MGVKEISICRVIFLPVVVAVEAVALLEPAQPRCLVPSFPAERGHHWDRLHLLESQK